MTDFIQYFKWNNKDYKNLFKSIKNILKINELQLYFPILAIYFYYHNTKNSHKIIDINRRYYLKNINKCVYEKYYHMNKIFNCQIYDKIKNTSLNKELFCKIIPILDPLHFMMNNYNNHIKRNQLLPSNYNYNTSIKINDLNNSAYIDVFLSFLLSELTIKEILPSFPIFYSTLNGIIEEYKFDLSNDYSVVKYDKTFLKYYKKIFTLDVYISDSEDQDSENSDSENPDSEKPDSEKPDSENSDSENSDSENSDSENSDSENKDSENSDSESNISYSTNSSCDNNDYISNIKNLPVQLLFIEKLDGTIEDFLHNDVDKINIDLFESCLFQVIFALTYLQKHLKFTHNDLHINNVMYSKTKKKYLYYKYNNLYFKIPTHGYIFKIIDFGRSIFTYKKRLFFNDSFYKYGEAEGQYSSPNNHLLFINKNDIIEPNFNFDLCRLAITIFDEIYINKKTKYNDNIELFIQFCNELTLNKDNNSLKELDDDFDMYIIIAKEACNAIPHVKLLHKIFEKYRVKKKNFPRKYYYGI
jgi:hypothetical protein